LWQQSFPQQTTLEDKVDLLELAEQYELSGSEIMNVVQYCCLQALKRGDGLILYNDILCAIKREFSKTGRLLSSVANTFE
jgi:ATP-dependent 26S proteasome regulatory subunit